MAAGRPGRLHFFGEVLSELRKVVWPSREEATRLTIMVVAVSVAVGIILGIVDMGFTEVLQWVLGK
ncbi:MAG: preprotein translocase subunit SecE [Chloroflexi bacterium]|nr:preprotein translocase subunit SecE [Chloroflexota bacterium]